MTWKVLSMVAVAGIAALLHYETENDILYVEKEVVVPVTRAKAFLFIADMSSYQRVCFFYLTISIQHFTLSEQKLECVSRARVPENANFREQKFQGPVRSFIPAWKWKDHEPCCDGMRRMYCKVSAHLLPSNWTAESEDCSSIHPHQSLTSHVVWIVPVPQSILLGCNAYLRTWSAVAVGIYMAFRN